MVRMPVALGTQAGRRRARLPSARGVRRFLRYRLAIVGVIMLAIIVLMAIFAPLLTPWPPNWLDFSTGARQPPSRRAHPRHGRLRA